jgi:hypothetical protein
MLNIPLPSPSANTAASETVSGAPNAGNPIEPEPVDAADVEGVQSDNDVPDNADAGATEHIQHVPVKGVQEGEPVRVRHAHSKVTLGSHVKSEPRKLKSPGSSEREREAEKARIFTRRKKK